MPSAAIDDGIGHGGRESGTEEREEVDRPPEREAAHKAEERECGNISRSKEADRADKNKKGMSKRADFASLVLRVAAGLIFLPHGYSKVFGSGVAAFAADMPSYGLPIFLGYIAAYAEFFGSIALIAGLLTRIDAFLLACTMFVAAFVVQLPDALHEAQPGTVKLFAILRGIELPLAMFAITAAVTILGPGRFSLDGVLGLEGKIMNAFRPKGHPSANGVIT